MQAQTARENKALSEKYTSLSLDDLDKALNDALGQFDQGAKAGEGLSPYADTGKRALSRLGDMYGLNGGDARNTALSGFTASPDYQFRLSQGVQALDRSANSRGGLYSGAAGKALVDYGQQAGSQEFGNWWDRNVGGLTGLASGGQNAASNMTNLTSNLYGSRANAILGTGQNKANARSSGLAAVTGNNAQAGAAQAGGMINSANAWNAGLQNLSQLAMFTASHVK